MKICDLIECSYNFEVFGITDDSRNVKENYLFVATKGFFVDHFNFIDDAIANGAICIIADRFVEIDIPLIVVKNINSIYSELCSRFYNVIPSEFNLIGITGTDGKTTTATIIYQLLKDVNNIACMGTNGILLNEKHYITNNTTPCISELYSSLNLLKSNDCKDVVMEVSSEALLHNRVDAFKYDAVCITNITEDHLNIHKTIENYRQSKFKLLNLVKHDGIIVVNGDDNNCKFIDKSNVYKVGVNENNDFIISDVKFLPKNVNFTILYKENTYNIQSPLLGMYNVYNVAMAFAICLLKGIDSNYLINKIKGISTIAGRGERLNFGQNFDIILDYAHTYNGIKNILESVRSYNKIITVTGAAGGREREKRSKIGKLVLEKSDIAILTMDDPRYENVDDIIDEMVSDTDKPFLRIVDRKTAIKKALELADNNSVVLILGKGRDNYMAICDRKEKYCDYDVVKKFFGKEEAL